MTDDTQPEAREFTMSQYASKDDMIGAMRKRIAELESELEAVGAGGVSGPLYLGSAPPTAQAEGWRPIETAPKHESVLLYSGKFTPIYCGRKRYGLLGEPQQDVFAWRCDSSGRFAHPTHWMPLPLPPTSAEGVEHG